MSRCSMKTGRGSRTLDTNRARKTAHEAWHLQKAAVLQVVGPTAPPQTLVSPLHLREMQTTVVRRSH